MFPCLETLQVDGIIKFNATEDGTGKRYPNLNEINCKRGLMDQACLDYLKATSPNIQDICMQITDPSDINIDISDWELKRLRLISRRSMDSMHEATFCCFITTPSRTNAIVLNPDAPSLAIVSKRSRLYHQELPRPTIVTTKEKHFMFNGFSISLLGDKMAIGIIEKSC
jgi:hypothetical protein